MVAAGFFCDVEVFVAFGDEFVNLADEFPLLAGKPQRNRYGNYGVVPSKAVVLDRSAEAFGALFRVFGADTTEEQHELFAAVAGKQIGFALLVLENFCDFLEHHVSALVAPCVVHALEVVNVHHDAVNVIVVAPCEREFTEAPVHEGAAVRNLGERIRRRSLEKFTVDSLFGGILEFHFQDHRADLQAVVGAKDCLGDGVAVDVGAVGAAEVFHGDVQPVETDFAVLAAYEFVVQVDIGIAAATEDDAANREGDLLELGLRIQHDEMRSHLTRLKPDRLVSCDDSLV